MPIPERRTARVPTDTTSTLRPAVYHGDGDEYCRLIPANVDGPFHPPEWLWEGRIPLGELTILAGRGEVGKTTIALDLAAQLSRGELPGATFGLKGKTIFCSDEASFEGVITPRYVAAGGARGGLYGIEFFEPTDIGAPVARPMTLAPSDTRMLAEAVDAEKVDLLILDPIDMVLGGIDAHRNNEVRAALRRIMSAGCTVIGIQHITKSSGALHAGDRVMGSVAYRNYARSVLVAAPDRSDPDLIVLAHDKCNPGRRQPSLALRTVASDIEGFARVKWLHEVDTSADDLLARRQREPSLLEQCRRWLGEFLEVEGPTEAAKMVELADEAGFGRTTVYDARKLLGVTTDRFGRWKL